MKGKMVFRLFANCILVKGAVRVIIQDVQRETIQPIPPVLHEMLTVHQDKTLAEILEVYPPAAAPTIREYYAFLEHAGFGHWTDTPEAFPELSTDFVYPKAIANAIVDFGLDNVPHFPKIIRELNDLGCEYLEMRIFSAAVTTQHLLTMVTALQGSRLRGVEVLLPYAIGHDMQVMRQLMEACGRLVFVQVYSCPEELAGEQKFGGIVNFTAQKLKDETCCGQIHQGYFSNNIKTYTEGQQFNTCLHKKIAVDQYGAIKNCPSMATHFGHIADTSLHEALARKNFKDLWEINKDQIAVCQDCEFRYACTDCRAYITDPEDRYSKPAKCTYDPYTLQWG